MDDWFNDFQFESCRPAESTEYVDCHGSVFAEKEVRSFYQTLCRQFSLDDLGKEFRGRQVQQRIVRRIDDHGIDAAVLEQLQLTLGCCQGRRSVLRAKEDDGMWIKGKDDGPRLVLMRIGEQGGEHPSMPPVNSVEITDGDEPAAIGFGFVKTVDDLHGYFVMNFLLSLS